MTRTNENAGRQPGADTSEHFSIENTAEYGIKQRAKRVIVALALYGLLPVALAERIIRRGGLRHE